MSPKESSKSRALFLAGHPALDFLNTRMRVNGDLVDILESDGDVIIWLKQAGFAAPMIAGGTLLLAREGCGKAFDPWLKSERREGREILPSSTVFWRPAKLSTAGLEQIKHTGH